MWDLKNNGSEAYIGILKASPDSLGKILYEDRHETYSGMHVGNCFDGK
jgi:hypothetical protein